MMLWCACASWAAGKNLANDDMQSNVSCLIVFILLSL